MTRPDFVYAIQIATTPERLWEALTSAEFTSRYWHGRRVASTWRKGDPVVMTRSDGGADFEGEILEVDPPRRLVFRFHVQDGAAMQAEGPSRVTYDLKPEGSTVRLTVTHDEFPEGSAVHAGISQGWPGILSGLKTLLETGRPMPAAAAAGCD